MSSVSLLQIMSERDSVGMDIAVPGRQANVAPRDSLRAWEQICAKRMFEPFHNQIHNQVLEILQGLPELSCLEQGRKVEEMEQKKTPLDLNDIKVSQETKRMKTSKRSSPPVSWQWSKASCAMLERSRLPPSVTYWQAKVNQENRGQSTGQRVHEEFMKWPGKPDTGVSR